MALRKTWNIQQLTQVVKAGLLLLALSVGCDRDHSASDSSSASAGATENNSGPSGSHALLEGIQYQEPFAEAIRQEPPADWQRPPDLTLTGKSVGKLYTEVERRWDTIRFITSGGKPIAYRAVLETELGSIDIELRPDLAPNHVRNFVALALVGYYDGLVFERTVRARSEQQPETEVELIEGGCPGGTGDLGQGSIGYWLKPEFSKEPHEVGTVAACHGEEADTAACRFYITLTRAPFLDGSFTVFGKVSQGVDVAQRIFSLPVRNDPEYPEGDRPENPVVIRKVTIFTCTSGSSWQPLSQ